MRGHRTLSPLVIAGAALFFTLGFSLSAVVAEIGRGGLAATRSAGAGDRSAGLDPLPAYYRTLAFLKDQYAGELTSDSSLTYAAIRGLLRPLDDPFTRFLDPTQYRVLKEQNQGGYVGVGALLDPHRTPDGYVRVKALAPGTQAHSAGLRPADLILKVDGSSTRSLRLDQILRLLEGGANAPVRLTVRRAGRPLVLTIRRRWVDRPVVESQMSEGHVGVIRLFEFNDRADAQVDEALTRLERQGLRALILDLRGNPGGTLDAAQEVASRFLPAGKTVVTMVQNGAEPEVRPVLEQKHNHRFNQRGRAIPLVVLVNRTSASAAEIVAGAIQDHHAGVILGTRTYGKGLVQTVVPLRGGAAIAVTSARYLTPSGTDINRRADRRGGISPDVLVDATEEDWRKRNDVQLRTALQLLQNRIGYKRSAAHSTRVSLRAFPSPGR